MKSKRQRADRQEEKSTFQIHVTVSHRAAAALMRLVATGRSLPEVVSSVVEEWGSFIC